MQSMLMANPAIGKANIVPTIKDSTYLAIGAENATNPIVREHLAGDLWIVYALDLPTRIENSWGVTDEGIGTYSSAASFVVSAKLEPNIPEIQRHGEGPWYRLAAGGDSTASLLLIEELWAKLDQLVEGVF